jgi:hypothetical protein
VEKEAKILSGQHNSGEKRLKVLYIMSQNLKVFLHVQSFEHYSVKLLEKISVIFKNLFLIYIFIYLFTSLFIYLFIYLFVRGLLNHGVSISDSTVMNGRMISEQWTDKHMEGSGLGTIKVLY